MIRTGLAIVALGLLAVFGYFFVTASGQRGQAERAKHAAVETKDAVVDQSVAGFVRARLATKYGLDGARFLHVYFDEGRVLVYGLLPPNATAEQIAAEADEVPGVRDAEVRALPRPEYLAVPHRAGTDGAAGGDG